MKIPKKKIRNFLLVIFTILIMTIGAVAYFFIANDAPIVNGEVIRHIKFKNELELDIYLPTKDKYINRPVIVFFHGGAWIGGSKSVINVNRFNEAINRLRDEGYAIVSPNYSLANEEQSPFPHCIYDGFDAVNWVYNHQETYKFDINNIGVFGESAGAHIAMMVAYSDIDSLPTPIQYVVDAYGPSDLYKLSRTSTVDSINAVLDKMPDVLKDKFNITQHLYGFDPKSDTVRAKSFANEHSPICYLSSKASPILIIHGDDDHIVPIEQSIELLKKLDSTDNQYEKHFLSEVDHAFIGASTTQKDSIQNWIYDFVIDNYND